MEDAVEEQEESKEQEEQGRQEEVLKEVAWHRFKIVSSNRIYKNLAFGLAIGLRSDMSLMY